MELKRGYKRTEVGVIPEDWEVASLSDMAGLQVGFAFESAWFGGTRGPRLLRGENVGYGYADWSDARTLESKSVQAFREYFLRPGEVVIGMDRTFTKSGVKISMIRETDCPCLLVQRVGRFLPRKCTQEFLWFVLSSEQVLASLRLAQKGMDIPHLSRTEVLHPLAAFPPVPEQQAIAEVLGDVDALIGALDRLIAKKRDLKQAAMQQLLTGQTRLPGFGGRWEVKSLRDLCRAITDGTHFTPTYVASGVPFYSVENVTANDFKNTKFISVADHRKLIVRCKPERGDILLTRIGSIGDTRLIDWDLDASIYVSLALLKLKPSIHAKYLYAYTRSRQFVRDLEDRSLLNAAPKKTNMGEIGGVPIPVPCPEEQSAIASVLSDMDADLSALEGRLHKTRLLRQGMMQELLTGRIRLS